MDPSTVAATTVNLIGFVTGTTLYVMLIAMVRRDRSARGSVFGWRARLPLATGICGVVWNVGGLAAFCLPDLGAAQPSPVIAVLAFSALGALPAVVVQSLLESRRGQASQGSWRTACVVTAYALSGIAALMHAGQALRGGPIPSRPALWLLTAGFTVLAVVILIATWREPTRPRGVWIAGLSVFAVSALHLSQHRVGDSWWVELAGHHASLPLAFAILYQDYRFALADLFLKNALSLLLLMGVTLAAFSGVMLPMLSWRSADGGLDPLGMIVLVAVWMATALAFPSLRRVAAWLVDRAVLRRGSYDATLASLADSVEGADDEAGVITAVVRAVTDALAASEVRQITVEPENVRRLPVVRGADLRGVAGLRLPVARIVFATVEPPYAGLEIGGLREGRRLLSDDVRLLEHMALIATRRVDSLRATEARLVRELSEELVHRLATEAELRALRAQLNPHFLFNALTTIGYLIQTAPERALDTLLRLTMLLHSVLRTEGEFTTLGRERDLIEAYLQIEQERFEERLAVHIDIPQPLLDIPIPCLILQPLVENAIKHGIANVPEGGIVTVRAETDADGFLRITVKNSGAGLSPEASVSRRGVGLRNIERRLSMYYGDQAEITLSTGPGGDTVAELVLPRSETPRGPSPLAAGGRRS